MTEIEQVEYGADHRAAEKSCCDWLDDIPTVRMHFEQYTHLEQAHQIHHAEGDASTDSCTYSTIARYQYDTQRNIRNNRHQRIEERELIIASHQKHIPNSACSSIE